MGKRCQHAVARTSEYVGCGGLASDVEQFLGLSLPSQAATCRHLATNNKARSLSVEAVDYLSVALVARQFFCLR